MLDTTTIKTLFERGLEKITSAFPPSISWGLEECTTSGDVFIGKAWITVPQNMQDDKLQALLSDVSYIRDTMQESLLVGGIQAILSIETRSVNPDPTLEPPPKEEVYDFKQVRKKHDEDMENTVLDYLGRIGNKKIACQASGIDPRTLARWEDEDPEFEGKVRIALGQFTVRRLEKILEAGEKYFQANAWALERLFPDIFAKHTVAEVKEWSNDDLVAYASKAEEKSTAQAQARQDKKEPATFLELTK